MSRITNFLLLLALSLGACGGPTDKFPVPSPASPSVDQLGNYRQLVGAWLDSTTSDRFTMFEAWHIQDDSTLVGHSYALAGKDTVFFEELRLEVRDAVPTYLARIDDQNNGSWVPFHALNYGPDSLIFENPGHEYPQCIGYIRTEAGHWDVMVSGTQNGVDQQDRSHLVAR